MSSRNQKQNVPTEDSNSHRLMHEQLSVQLKQTAPVELIHGEEYA